jgi:hypothetical protein
LLGEWGALILIKIMSTTLEDGQQVPLIEHEKVVQSSRKQGNNTSKTKHTNKKQEGIPTALSIEHGASPTREDLQRYLWWSEGSQQNIRFTDQMRQTFQNEGTENKEVIISQFPYQVAQNILYYDYSNLENPMHIDDHPSIVMSWEGDKLLLTPNDNQPYKEERGEILIPIEKTN